MAEPYLRVAIKHDDGTTGIYHCREVVFTDPLRVRSDVGGVITILPLEEGTEEITPESRGHGTAS